MITTMRFGTILSFDAARLATHEVRRNKKTGKLETVPIKKGRKK